MSDILIPIVKHCGRSSTEIKDREKELYSLTLELTEEEAKSPYARYYHMGRTAVSLEFSKHFEYDAMMDPTKAIMPDEFKRVNRPGYMEVENGFCILPNGIGYAAILVKQDGLTDEMMQHFITHFNPEGDLFYKIWCPTNHYRHYTDLAIEDYGWGPCALDFKKIFGPENTGLGDAWKANDPDCIFIIGANVATTSLHHPNGEPIYGTEIQYHRYTPTGREIRIRFWLGLNIENGKPLIHLPNNKPIDPFALRSLGEHAAWEFGTYTRNIKQFWEDCQTGKFQLTGI
jgi:hypothetical protein